MVTKTKDKRGWSDANQARKDAVIAGLRAGKGLSEIAGGMGLKYTSLFTWCSRWKVPTTASDLPSESATLSRDQKEWGADLDANERRKMIRRVAHLLNDGKTIDRIAEGLGVGAKTLRHWCKTVGMPPSAGEPLSEFMHQFERNEKNRLAAGRVTMPAEKARRLLPHAHRLNMSPEIMVGEIIDRLLDEPDLIKTVLDH